MSKHYICSTLASDNAYTVWHRRKEGGNDLPKKLRQVVIKGGARVADNRLVTPHGVVTQITGEELELLKSHCPPFNRHLSRGFLKILARDPSSSDKKKIAADLSEDKSTPITPQKLAKEGKKSGSTKK